MSAHEAGSRSLLQSRPAYNAARHAHASCMVCGDPRCNADSLGLKFVLNGERGVSSLFTAGPRHQGYDGLLHGGIICTLLDAAMVHCLFAQGICALTAEMTVRFVTPIEVGRQVALTGQFVENRRGIYRVDALVSWKRQVFARASAKFVEPKTRSL
jgi:uncharacterized protein (TIGR00369 family)